MSRSVNFSHQTTQQPQRQQQQQQQRFSYQQEQPSQEQQRQEHLHQQHYQQQQQHHNNNKQLFQHGTSSDLEDNIKNNNNNNNHPPIIALKDHQTSHFATRASSPLPSPKRGTTSQNSPRTMPAALSPRKPHQSRYHHQQQQQQQQQKLHYEQEHQQKMQYQQQQQQKPQYHHHQQQQPQKHSQHKRGHNSVNSSMDGGSSDVSGGTSSTAATNGSDSSNGGNRNSQPLTTSSEAWRKSGKLYRANLILMDEEKGGNSIQLSDGCSIDRYYRVAERVMEQFLSTSIGESHELTESYLVGSRLVKFLSVVLPTHPDYLNHEPRLAALRQRSQEQLIELLQYMEELALLIDEMQYNKYILDDLTPEDVTDGSISTGQNQQHSLDSISSDKENHNHGALEQKIAAVVTGQATVGGENGFLRSDPYKQHVAAVLAAQPPPPPPPVRRGSTPKTVRISNTTETEMPPEQDTLENQQDSIDWDALIPSDSKLEEARRNEITLDSSFSDLAARSRTESMDHAETTRRQSPSSSRPNVTTDIDEPTRENPESPLSAAEIATSPSNGSSIPKLPQPRSAPPRRTRVAGYSRKVANFEDSVNFGEGRSKNASKSSRPDKRADAMNTERQEEQLTLRIEERWEQAQRRERNQRQFEQSQWRGQYGKLKFVQQPPKGQFLRDDPCEDVTPYSGNRRLLKQFKGCIKCLLD